MSKKLKHLSRRIAHFIHTESASSVVLGGSTVLAMLLANGAAADHYKALLHFNLAGLSVHHWINDGLMAIFFFVVGMEIKREVVAGELSTWKQAALPLAAAIGGMVVPALIYYGLNPEGSMAKGWAIPMATDIAFALGVLVLLGRRVPLSLKIFLLALAIVDDLGAVLVIATFFTEQIRAMGILIFVAGLLAIVVAQKRGVANYYLYVPLGILAWFGMLYSGVHATIAGVAIGLMTPLTFATQDREQEFSPLNHLIETLHPWVGFAIMPIFALANAGIEISGTQVSDIFNSPVTQGVFLGLVLGKPIGILMACSGVVALGLAQLPRDLKWAHLVGAGSLAGIGFTMSIFITNLSLPDNHLVDAKIAVLGASLVSAAMGFVILKLQRPQMR